MLVFTNLTQDHLDFHGTMEEYYAAKAALFDQAERAVINVGDEWGRRLAATLPAARTFTPDDELGAIDLKLRGRFNRANALGAVWAARELGVDEEAIRAGIAALDGVPGRFESVEAGQPFAVIVDYAHTPDSLENVLRTARELGGRLTVVFGAGGDRDREKRPLMGADRRPARRPRDRDHRQPALRGPRCDRGRGRRAGSSRSCSTGGRRSRRALGRRAPGDVVVIAGKGADTEMELAGHSIPFDDRAGRARGARVIPVELERRRAAGAADRPARGPTP